MADSVTRAPIMDPQLWGSVGEELLEKIIARLPMKVLMQSQVLSKKWRSVFQSPLFQAEVSSVSSSWRSYYPLYVTEKTLMGYDRFSGRWQELFALPDFPEDFCRGFSGPLYWTLSLCGVTGALITLSYFSNHVLHTYVTNPINKTVRRLPPLDMSKDGPLDPRFDEWEELPLFPISHNSYRVLVFSRSKEENVLLLRVYISESNSWSEPKRGPQLPWDFRGFDSGACLDKIFYFAFLKSVDESHCTLRSCLEDLMLFYAYNVDAGEFREMILPSPQQVPDMAIRSCKLVACGTELLLVVWQGSPEEDEDQRQEAITAMRTTLTLGVRPGNAPEEIDEENLLGAHLYIPKNSFFVFRLDRETLQLTEISRGPTENLSSRTFTGLVVCDNDTIYLQTESTAGDSEFGIVMFDMRRQVWSSIPQDIWSTIPQNTENCDLHNVKLTEFAFQPGLNPFTAA